VWDRSIGKYPEEKFWPKRRKKKKNVQSTTILRTGFHKKKRPGKPCAQKYHVLLSRKRKGERRDWDGGETNKGTHTVKCLKDGSLGWKKHETEARKRNWGCLVKSTRKGVGKVRQGKGNDHFKDL